MDLNARAEEFQRRFDALMRAREVGLASSRKAIRSSANAIRAIHRGDFDKAEGLMNEARAALAEGSEAMSAHPEILHAGFHQDAQKEYAEARVTAALIQGVDLPGPEDLEVGLPAYLNGVAESIGEARRSILDRLRTGEVADAERLLGAMDDLYGVLVQMDYPDAVTGNLRRITDVARGILEKTRGDLTTSLVQRDLRDAIERNASPKD